MKLSFRQPDAKADLVAALRRCRTPVRSNRAGHAGDCGAGADLSEDTPLPCGLLDLHDFQGKCCPLASLAYLERAMGSLRRALLAVPPGQAVPRHAGANFNGEAQR